VHSLTDISISEEDYTTDSTTLWLVENRAITTEWFKVLKIIIIGVKNAAVSIGCSILIGF
jgi:hypothetical protein